jgi:hypothetical protein
VSPTERPDPVVGALFVANLVADEESARIESLSEEELLAEMQREGEAPPPAMGVEDLLAKVSARAAGQGRVVGPEPAATAKAPTPPEGRVVPLSRRRPRTAWWAAAAASVAAIVGAATLEGPVIVSHFRPPTPQEKAEGLRDEAIADCARGSWGPCAQRLDEAARLDPAGESAERVQKAREAIAKATHPGPGVPNGPGR